MIAKRIRLGLLLLPIATTGCFIAAADEQDRPFDILLTNDDGIESPGIQALAEALATVGTVHVIAPCGQQSGASMSVSLRATLQLQPRDTGGKTTQHCVDGSPAGAALLAITTLAPDGGYDLVVSGINRGANVGNVAHMSGTIGAAMMGAYYGIPAVAASLGGGNTDFAYTAKFVTGFVRQLQTRPATPGVVYSINVPRATEAEIAGVVIAKMGGSEYRFMYEEQPGAVDVRTFRPNIGRATEFPPETDTDAYMQDMITITPLQFDWTAYAAIDQLRAWDLHPRIGR